MMAVTASPRRKSSLAAQKRMKSQLDVSFSDEDRRARKANGKTFGSSSEETATETSTQKANGKDRTTQSSDYEDEGAPHKGIASKKRKVTNGRADRQAAAAVHARLFAINGATSKDACEPPQRKHPSNYHRPLLLEGRDGAEGRAALLSWFDTVSSSRAMPWRKKWIDPRSYNDLVALRQALERRAYEVWISEIMLQQTRVAVVIDYWNRWMERWPTIQDLAQAQADDVLSAWRGLGYYSRATRIHEAAKKVVSDKTMQGLLPGTAEELQAKVPGVGRYTGGAISAIVFGHAAPMVDGNVLRVLSRQLGLYGNVKTDKAVIDTLWAAADALVKAVAHDVAQRGEATVDGTSDGPGRWGQAVMELGSTVCTPKPTCGICPISDTCRANAEGRILAGKANLSVWNKDMIAASPPDIEDLCTLCEPFDQLEEETVEDDEDTIDGLTAVAAETSKTVPKTNKAKQATLASFVFTKKPDSSKTVKLQSSISDPATNAKAMEVVVGHAKKFPVKVVKKAVREEETIVCAIQREDGLYLIHKRPDKGLLAGLWEFPSHILPNSNDSTPAKRNKHAQEFISSQLQDSTTSKSIRHLRELGSVPWLFSHLKLTMHVHLFRIEGKAKERPREADAEQRWASTAQVEAESMGTGMRKCWALIKDALR